jgi:hypothetical protein
MGIWLIALDVILWAVILVFALVGNVVAVKLLLILLTISALLCMYRITVLMRQSEQTDHSSSIHCGTCGNGEDGVCYDCYGDNFGHATEISNNSCCRNYRARS